jgi:1,2-diacylglycerol 3-alpha-glucosyltransferase
MRIGFVADTYKPYTSGVTHYIALNKQALEAMGQQVSVFAFGNPSYDPGELNVFPSSGLTLPNGYSFGLRFSPSAEKAMQQMDILHSNHPFVSGAAALKIARRGNIPIVFTNHTRYDLYMRAYLPFIPPRLGRAYLKSVLPRYFQAVDRAIAPSAGLAKVLRGLNVKTPLEVIPNGVDLRPFQSGDRAQGRARLDARSEELLLVFVGRLTKEKNVRFLVQSFAQVAAECPNARLVLVGGGNQQFNLLRLARQAGIAERIHITGALPYADIPDLLAAGDVFVTASVSEVHPLTVIEALAAGMPVVGIHSPGVSDTIRSGVNGLLAENNLESFSACLKQLALSPETRAAMSQGARESAQEYAIQRTAGLLLDLYQRVLAERRL